MTIVVMPVNDPPLVQPVSLTTDENAPVEKTLPGNNINSARTSYVELISTPLKTEGVATIHGATLRFEPAKDWNGTASFAYRERDPKGAYSAAARVPVLVWPINNAPTAMTPLQMKTVESRSVTVRARVTTQRLCGEKESFAPEDDRRRKILSPTWPPLGACQP